MKIIQDFLFFDDVTSAGISNTMYSPNGGELTLSVISSTGATYVLKVQGRIDVNESVWVDLSSINMTSLAVGTSISADGGYSIPINGVGNIRCEITSLTGTLKVFGKVTE